MTSLVVDKGVRLFGVRVVIRPLVIELFWGPRGLRLIGKDSGRKNPENQEAATS